jgi:uncharacterized protein YegL
MCFAVFQINFSANVEAGDTVRFRLTYEELLQRKNGQYDYNINVNPGQVVDDFTIVININESLPLKDIKVPIMENVKDNEIDSVKLHDDPLVNININVDNDPNKASITFKPSVLDQKNGIHGQFRAFYDVERPKGGNDIQLAGGRFVHYFAPDELDSLPKHLVFVIDVSGSMDGKKLDQTKDAMVTIIDKMNDQDSLNIITFSDKVYHWTPASLAGQNLETYKTAKDTRIKSEAVNYALNMKTIGGTNINTAMLEAIKKINEVKESGELDPKTKQLIIFLTDGEATTGITNKDEIKANIQKVNKDIKVPIYGLAFGNGADFGLIRDISKANHAFAKRIYESGDSYAQLENFVKELSDPKLNKVKFQYLVNGSPISNKKTTKTKLNTFYSGNEYVIVGSINAADTDEIEIIIQGEGANGPYEKRIYLCHPPRLPPVVLPAEAPGQLRPVARPTPTNGCIDPWFPHPTPQVPQWNQTEAEAFMERLWAFKKIKHLLNEAEAEADYEDEEPQEGGEPTFKDQAKNLALEYNFVTTVTSLVVTYANGDEKPIEPVPVESLKEQNSNVRLFTNHAAYPTSYSSNTRRHYSAGSGGSIFKSVMKMQAPRRRPTMTTTYRPMTTTTYRPSIPPPINHQIAADYMYESSLYMHVDKSDYFDGFEPVPNMTCQGSLTLYNETHQRGESVQITGDIEDLSSLNFDDLLTSLKIEGNCCWQIYNEPTFSGDSMRLNPGQYDSPTKLKKIFRKASSLKKLFRC